MFGQAIAAYIISDLGRLNMEILAIECVAERTSRLDLSVVFDHRTDIDQKVTRDRTISFSARIQIDGQYVHRLLHACLPV